MRLHSLLGLGLLTTLAAGCGDARTDHITAAEVGPSHNNNPIITVSGETWEGTQIAWGYAGGQINVHYVDSSNNATYAGTIQADSYDYDSFQAPTGSRVRMTAVATASGCSFSFWGLQGQWIYSATIYADDYPDLDSFIAFFTC